MKRNELIKKAKVIVLPFLNCYGDTTFHDHMKTFMENEKIKIDNIYLTDRYAHNHHMTTQWHYNILLPKVVSLLNINFKNDDFFKIKNIKNNNDFSFLIPSELQFYEITYFKITKAENTLYYNDDYIELNSNELTSVTNILNEDIFTKDLNIQDNYHKLIKNPDATYKIHNTTNCNGKQLVLIGDSHMIPLISIMCRYYEDVIIFDNRFGIKAYDFLTQNLNDDCDCLIIAWENVDTEQIIEKNLI